MARGGETLVPRCPHHPKGFILAKPAVHGAIGPCLLPCPRRTSGPRPVVTEAHCCLLSCAVSIFVWPGQVYGSVSTSTGTLGFSSRPCAPTRTCCLPFP